MSLLYYEDKFTQLNVNRSGNRASPHKVAMLLAVIDLIEAGGLTQNEIAFSQQLNTKFSERFNTLKSDSDRDNPHLPFFHLRSDGFWHHELLPGKRESYIRLSTASGPRVIKEHIAFAYLDDELFELLQNELVRNLLKTSLEQSLIIDGPMRKQLLQTDGWDWLECEACVNDYFEMLSKEIRGEKFSKAEHRESLATKLNDRSKGSIEFKHQNISAVLLELGFPYVAGYKPRFNYQRQLRDAVVAHIAAKQPEFDTLTPVQERPPVQYVRDWEKVLDTDLPEKIPRIRNLERKFLARKTNFAQKEAANRLLGASGEEFVVDYERYRLRFHGREDLADEVEWSSKERGDGLGYDVRSFPIINGVPKEEELFIEVKTTSSGKYQPFMLTENELEFSRQFANRYSLYRVYDMRKQARLFQLRL